MFPASRLKLPRSDAEIQQNSDRIAVRWFACRAAVTSAGFAQSQTTGRIIGTVKDQQGRSDCRRTSDNSEQHHRGRTGGQD